MFKAHPPPPLTPETMLKSTSQFYYTGSTLQGGGGRGTETSRLRLPRFCGERRETSQVRICPNSFVLHCRLSLCKNEHLIFMHSEP